MASDDHLRYSFTSRAATLTHTKNGAKASTQREAAYIASLHCALPLNCANGRAVRKRRRGKLNSPRELVNCKASNKARREKQPYSKPPLGSALAVGPISLLLMLLCPPTLTHAKTVHCTVCDLRLRRPHHRRPSHRIAISLCFSWCQQMTNRHDAPTAAGQ